MFARYSANMLLRFVLLSVITVSRAQQCYYPNGNPVKAEPVAPCYSWGGACCPVGWTCLSNNLCFQDIESQDTNLTGRYSCVDQEWGRSCPNFCHDDQGSAGGNEAVQHCGGTDYCCNGRGLSTDQCCKTGTSFFHPGHGTPVSTISTAADTALTASSSATPVRLHKTTQTTQSVVSSSGDTPRTVQVTVISTALVTPTAPSESSASALEAPANHPNNVLARAIGIPVGILAGLIFIGLGYCAYKYQYKNKRRPSEAVSDGMSKNEGPTTAPNSPVGDEFVGMSAVGGRESDIAMKEMSSADHQHTMSELGGSEVLQLHEEPKIAELPVEGSGKG